MANIHKDRDNLLPMSTWRISSVTVMVLVIIIFLYPSTADTNFEIAISLAQKGDLSYSEGLYQEALTAYNNSVLQDPYNSNVWNKLGETQAHLGQYSEAADSFDRAIKLDPYFSRAWVNKGDALKQLGKIEDAITMYDRAIAINPNDLHALVNRGINLEELGMQEEAQKSFNDVIRISDKEIRVHPNDARYDAELWNQRGTALSRLGRYREALQSYDEALSINPKHVDALKNKQDLLFTLDTIGNVTLPKSVPTTIGVTTRPTKKPAGMASYLPIIGVFILVFGWYRYGKNLRP
jgi:tetratricopeptide (TPR) repeat protein